MENEADNAQDIWEEEAGWSMPMPLDKPGGPEVDTDLLRSYHTREIQDEKERKAVALLIGEFEKWRLAYQEVIMKIRKERHSAGQELMEEEKPLSDWQKRANKWLEEQDHQKLAEGEAAFHEALPVLLVDHSGKWVGYHGREQIALGRSQMEVVDRCKSQGLPLGEVFVGKIDERVNEEDVEIGGAP